MLQTLQTATMTGKLAIILTSLVVASSPVYGLWPQPKSIQTGSTAVRLAPNFNIQVSVKNAPKDLQDAITQAKNYLQKDKLERLVVGRGSSDGGAISGAKSLSALTLSLTSSNGTVRSISDESKDAIESRDEAYSLTIPGDGSGATLKANSTLGLYRGLTTFGQLWYEYNGATYTLEAPVQVDDAPAYVCFEGPFMSIIGRLTGTTVAVSRAHVGHSQELVSIIRKYHASYFNMSF